jgi:hypothetical protein
LCQFVLRLLVRAVVLVPQLFVFQVQEQWLPTDWQQEQAIVVPGQVGAHPSFGE